MLVFCSFGVPTFSLPFIYEGAIKEFGWSRQEATSLATAKFLIGAVAALVFGRLLDQYKTTPVVIAGAGIGGLGLLAMLWVDNLAIYYLNGFMLGVGAASVSACMKVVVVRVFERQMGLALGIVFGANSVAGIVVPLIVAPMMQTIGWRQTLAFMSLGVWLVSIPAWLFLFHSGGKYSAKIALPTEYKPHASVWEHFKELAKERNFWLIGTSVFLIGVVGQGMSQNQVLFLRLDKGFDIHTVAWAASLFAAVGFFSKIAWGWVYDKISVRGVQLTYLMLAVAITLAFPVAGLMSMMIFVSMRGFAHGGLIISTPVLTKHYFGPQNIGLNMGILAVFINLGFALGPPLLARFADVQGTYSNGFILFITLAVLAATLLIPIRPRSQQRHVGKARLATQATQSG